MLNAPGIAAITCRISVCNGAPVAALNRHESGRGCDLLRAAGAR